MLWVFGYPTMALLGIGFVQGNEGQPEAKRTDYPEFAIARELAMITRHSEAGREG